MNYFSHDLKFGSDTLTNKKKIILIYKFSDTEIEVHN